MLCDIFSEHQLTYWYWVDGVEIDNVDLQPGRKLVLDGRAWCADDHVQWLVPAQIVIRFHDGAQPDISALQFRIGDIEVGTLKSHIVQRKRGFVRPEEWLFEFDVHRPTAPVPLNVEPFAVRLHDWITENSMRPVVGPDWQYFTRDQARQYIESRAGQGHLVSLTETWLDGGPALWIE
jgi:hypothetical protein